MGSRSAGGTITTIDSRGSYNVVRAKALVES
jgi:hypothetical protein